MARDAEPTRLALIAAAERLFATSGINRVSLREISRASGARNAVALQYHFESRDGILRAVLAKHYPDVDRARHALLNAYEAEQSDDVRLLSEALVMPLAAKLADADGGPEYLQINAELMNHPIAYEPNPVAGSSRSIDRWRALVEPHLAQDANRLHRRFTAIRFASVELGRRAQSGPHRDDRLFSSHLVDLVSALLVAPVSSQTTELATDRDRQLSVSR
ncbi:MAG TPA: helix-turn-helix domain-containing protein [Acidimicrobiales bacterium]|jgi:AcrR family transcriptional regulator|nr:helix-turn-helix domain-containing protein [Acidimicrobiales bacterium]